MYKVGLVVYLYFVYVSVPKQEYRYKYAPVLNNKR